ncbi:MAG: hypothetical protein ACR2F6_09815 [Mycobacteriales bacterium]
MQRQYCSVPQCRKRVTHVLALRDEPDLYLCDEHAESASAGLRDLDRVTVHEVGLPEGP